MTELEKTYESWRPVSFWIGLKMRLIYGKLKNSCHVSGRKFDKDGDLTQWWPDQAIEKFIKEATCFTEQYGKYKMDLIEEHVSQFSVFLLMMHYYNAIKENWIMWNNGFLTPYLFWSFVGRWQCYLRWQYMWQCRVETRLFSLSEMETNQWASTKTSGNWLYTWTTFFHSVWTGNIVHNEVFRFINERKNLFCVLMPN